MNEPVNVQVPGQWRFNRGGPLAISPPLINFWLSKNCQKIIFSSTNSLHNCKICRWNWKNNLFSRKFVTVSVGKLQLRGRTACFFKPPTMPPSWVAEDAWTAVSRCPMAAWRRQWPQNARRLLRCSVACAGCKVEWLIVVSDSAFHLVYVLVPLCASRSAHDCTLQTYAASSSSSSSSIPGHGATALSLQHYRKCLVVIIAVPRMQKNNFTCLL